MDIEQIKAITLFIITFLNFLAAYMLWQKGKTKATFHLGWVFFFAGLFAGSWAGLYFFNSYKLLWTKATWVGPLSVSSYVIFTYYFTERIKYIRLKMLFWYSMGFIIWILAFATPFLIVTVSDYYPYVNPLTAGILNKWARIYVIAGIAISIFYLFKDYIKETGFKKWQLKYFIWGGILSWGGALFFSGILLFLNYGKFAGSNDVSAFLTIIMVCVTSYAVLKNNLFDMKVVLTEVLVGIIGLILLTQIFLLPGLQARAISSIIFLLYLSIGYLLIRSTHKEIEKEQKAEQLARELEGANKNLEKAVAVKTEELQVKVNELSDSQKALVNLLEDNTKAREQMEEERDKTMALIANFTDPIIVLDKNNKISMINPSTKRIFGLDISDLGKEVKTADQFSMENFRSTIKRDYSIRKIGETADKSFVVEEMAIKEGDQEMTYKVITAKVLSTNNEFLGTMKIFYDLTREKIIDKLKSEFITIAAHQLRTPLSAIKWAIKLVLDGEVGKVNDEQHRLLYQGYLSNERVIVLINDMLNVSRIEEGRFGYIFGISDFREVLNSALESVEFQLKTKKIALIQHIPDRPMEMNMDKERMLLVLQNLIENAISYTPESGKIEITIDFGGKFMNLKIKDNGVGIPAKDQAKLFSKFFRADNVVRIQTEGSGLGLFITKNIINQHKGDISCKSEEGKGTEFDITLPIS